MNKVIVVKLGGSIFDNKDTKRIQKLVAALSIYDGDMFSRTWIKEMIK